MFCVVFYKIYKDVLIMFIILLDMEVRLFWVFKWDKG